MITEMLLDSPATTRRARMLEALMAHSKSDTIGRHLLSSGVTRRDFLQLCSLLMVTAPAGLALTKTNSVEKLAAAIGGTPRPSVIWLHFQECTGCTETLLRTSAPDVGHLILDIISLDYHETLMAAAGDQAEKALQSAITKNAGKYVLVVEGSIPLKDNGVYVEVGQKRGIDILKTAAADAAAIIAIGSCASWGGVQSSGPNPTGAVGVDSIISNKPIINLPGCPPNPYTLLAVVLEYATMGKLPALDSQKRPLFAYSRVIHENCPRRAHFDAGRFALAFGDEGHRQGWCLFKLGCKGPVTHAACSWRNFNEVPNVWPIGIGAPCVGCTEKAVGFEVPTFQLVDLHSLPATAPDTYAPIFTAQGHISPIATGVAGLIGGALVGAGIAVSRKLSSEEAKEEAAVMAGKE